MDAHGIIEAVTLGIIEGVTEFLPVSSTGHMLLADHFLKFSNTGDVFEVVIQFGAILAVVAVYFSRLWQTIKTLLTRRESQYFAGTIIAAFMPAVIIGSVLHGFIKRVLFANPQLIATMLIVGGIVILVVERLPKKEIVSDSEKLPIKTAVGVGLFQCLAMVPGVSRSGSTIIGGMLLGVSRKAIAEFSFFLSIPTMLAASVFDLYKSFGSLHKDDLLLIAIGFVVAFLSALVVVRGFIGFISKHGLVPFAWYRIIAGAAILIALAYGY